MAYAIVLSLTQPVANFLSHLAASATVGFLTVSVYTSPFKDMSYLEPSSLCNSYKVVFF